jgi:hypothetical protein
MYNSVKCSMEEEKVSKNQMKGHGEKRERRNKARRGRLVVTIVNSSNSSRLEL